MNRQDQEIWNEMNSFCIVDDSWTNVEKLFAIDLWKNNLEQVKQTLCQIDLTNIPRIQDMFIISAIRSGMDDNTSTFLFLSRTWILDHGYVNQSGTNCLLSACLSNGDLSLIKYLINDQKMDPFHTDTNQCNCLILACWGNANLEIIIFLLELFEGKENQVDKWGDNCFLSACERNQNLDIIKYLAQSGTVDTKITNTYGRDCFLKACIGNNLETIKYLISDLKIDTKKCNVDNDNCLNLACWRNSHLDVIKFLINDLNVSIDHQDKYGNNCLLSACMGGNLSAVKFLINDVKMSIDYKNISGENCIVVANKCKDIEKSSKTIEYLINETSICIDIKNMKLDTFKSVLPGISDAKRLNVLVRLMIKESPLLAKDVNLIFNDLNPFLLDSQNRKDAMIDVFEKQYQEIKNLVDSMDQRIESDTMNQSIVSVSETNSKSNSNSNKRSNVAFDFSKQSEFLFTHGSKNYHGQRKIVYESILLLKDVCCDDFFDLGQGLVLEGNLPTEIINQYIASAYTGFFDTQCMEESEDHFIDFLKFIDQYPMTNVSIDKLEHWIIGFIETHSMNLSRPDIEYLKLVCDKYMMKRLCVVLHNLAHPYPL